ncbi:hypothetical protein LMG33818_002206 [Halomonadaceae bacterium LMG 33818]|uniref:type III secretion system inner membrane ring lipoprotein SctJ n=1 Tax=Cernens ardua TaxID=3402176 RepID=UPI003EDC0E6F
MRKLFLYVLSFLLLAGLSACSGRYPLYSHLDENNANDIVAALESHGINAEREQQGSSIAVTIPSGSVQQAVQILNAYGLPRKESVDLGSMFQQDGIMSTPFDEKARYIYALSQQLESTLDQIDGVVTARVQVVLPQQAAPGQPIEPASASVFIKYRSPLDPDVLRPQILQLVATSIPGISDGNRNLSVVFVKADPISILNQQEKNSNASVHAPPAHGHGSIWLWVGLGVVIAIVVIVSVLTF